MAAARLWVTVICLSCVRAAIVTKGMFCVDPDTGKLYMVNTTWPSTTFCGNYTCRLRQKNLTEMEFSPSIPIVNITKITKDPNSKISNNSNQNNMFITRTSESDIKPTLHSHNKPFVPDGEEDRYLNEAEIKTISEILHTVRKSDLDAIVEIYNLAHDLYKELDKSALNNIKEEHAQEHEKKLNKEIKPVNDNHIKYWYEPISSGFNSKVNEESTNVGTETITTTEKHIDDTLTYFQGALTNNDFGKLPYRYQHINHKATEANIKPCPHQHRPINRPLSPPVWYNYDMKPSKIETPKMIQTPILLPFPLNYIQRQNFSSYATGYYNGIPWANYDYQSKNKNYPQTYLMSSYTNQAPGNDVNLIPHVREEKNINNIDMKQQPEIKATNTKLFQAIVNAANSHKDAKSRQTNHLPSNVLEEVKEHFKEKAQLLKAFPLTKKIRFEKIGKVIKLEDLKRSRRNINENVEMTTNFGNYETFVISTKCRFDTEPGFFKKGNLSKPYPDCCPQRIEKTNHKH